MIGVIATDVSAAGVFATGFFAMADLANARQGISKIQTGHLVVDEVTSPAEATQASTGLVISFTTAKPVLKCDRTKARG